MAKRIRPTGPISMALPDRPKLSVTDISVGTESGYVGSVIHGFRIEVAIHTEESTEVTLTLGAADALQLAEEILAAAHRREDVKRS
jgi:hypothetical protein